MYICNPSLQICRTHPRNQPAVLAHPSTRLFLSHCGANSVHEALALLGRIRQFPWWSRISPSSCGVILTLLCKWWRHMILDMFLGISVSWDSRTFIFRCMLNMALNMFVDSLMKNARMAKERVSILLCFHTQTQITRLLQIRTSFSTGDLFIKVVSTAIELNHDCFVLCSFGSSCVQTASMQQVLRFL